MVTYPVLGISLWKAGIVSAAVATVVFLTCARKVVLGGLAFVVLGALISLPVNPLYQGLGPLTSSPLLATFTKDAARPPDATHRIWLSFAGLNINDVLIASGVPTLNAVDFYPNPTAWRALDPHHRFASVWNRYANMYFAPGPTDTAPAIRLIQADVVSVTLDPCGTAAGKLGVGFVVATTPLSGSCLVLTNARTSTASSLFIYRRHAGAVS
jgi:hypothetical protein